MSKKTPYDAKRTMAVKAIAEQYQVTEDWVRKCVAGTATTGNAAAVKAAYAEKYKALVEIVGN